MSDTNWSALIPRSLCQYQVRANPHVTYMICPYSIDFVNVFAECHRLVDDQLEELVWCGLAR